jgi:GT2 family glycosyltransferase
MNYSLQQTNQHISETIIVLINYNKFEDTLHCLKSISRFKENKYKIVLVDNASQNKSCEKILDYLKKENIDFSNTDYDYREKSYQGIPSKLSQLNFIRSNHNGGFAYANNVAIRFVHEIMQSNGHDYWLLNTDVDCDERALKALVKARNYKANSSIGIFGSLIFDFDNRTQIQSIGGSINSFFCTSSNLTNLSDKPRIDYIIGASFYITRECFEKTGYMFEDYFLYFEETDYCFMAFRNGFGMQLVEDSIIYHKQSGSSNSKRIDVMQLRNRLLFAQRNGFSSFGVRLGLMVSVMNRLLRRQFDRVIPILKLIFTQSIS